MITDILQYLDQAATSFPERIAYEEEHDKISFLELKKRADSMGTALLKQGCSNGTVAIYMRKGMKMVSAFLGVASANNSYCPLDLAMPVERLNIILSTLEPCALCVSRDLWKQAQQLDYSGKILVYEELIQESEENKLLTRARKSRTDMDPLYIIFTSGSTGVPKGVVLPQRAVIDYMEWVTQRFRFTEKDRIGNQAELFFDLSVQDIYAPLVSGCCTVFFPPGIFSRPAELVKMLKEREITITLWTPSAYGIVSSLDGITEVLPSALRMIMFCGEVMPCKTLNYWRKKLPGITYVNLYGPTEAAVACTYYIIEKTFLDEEIIPIGIPCENTAILVLDEDGNEIKPEQTGKGFVGELCVKGSCLALGYCKNQEKTSEAFVQNPKNQAYPDFIYRTGDLVYWLDGNLMYVSRKDFQIKHMGYRIELGEIECACMALEGIAECACVYREESKRLMLYYTGKVWDNREMKEKLSERLPHYMIPNRVVHLEKMPHNRNGKIDRKIL